MTLGEVQHYKQVLAAHYPHRRFFHHELRVIKYFLWANREWKKIIQPNQQTIRSYLNMNLRTLQRVLRRLKGIVIAVERRYKQSNVYRLLNSEQRCLDFGDVGIPVEPSGNTGFTRESVVIVAARSKNLLINPGVERIESMSTIAEGCVENLPKKQTQKPSFDAKNAKAELPTEQRLTLAEAREMEKLANPSETAENIDKSARLLLNETPKPGSVTQWLMSGPSEFRLPDARKYPRNARLSRAETTRAPLSRRPPGSESSAASDSSGDVVAMKLTIRKLSVKKRLA